MTDSERSTTKLHEMVVRGTNFKEDFEFDLYGEEVTVILQPLVDDEFLPIAAFMAEHLDYDDGDEAISDSIDKIDEAREAADEDETVDVTKLDDEFVAVMQEAAKYGIWGGYNEDDEAVEHTEDEVEFLVENMMGGSSVELGGRALELSGDIRDAEKFRGGRGRVERSRDS